MEQTRFDPLWKGNEVCDTTRSACNDYIRKKALPSYSSHITDREYKSCTILLDTPEQQVQVVKGTLKEHWEVFILLTMINNGNSPINIWEDEFLKTKCETLRSEMQSGSKTDK